jgi:hypothetical protein
MRGQVLGKLEHRRFMSFGLPNMIPVLFKLIILLTAGLVEGRADVISRKRILAWVRIVWCSHVDVCGVGGTSRVYGMWCKRGRPYVDIHIHMWDGEKGGVSLRFQHFHPRGGGNPIPIPWEYTPNYPGLINGHTYLAFLTHDCVDTDLRHRRRMQLRNFP